MIVSLAGMMLVVSLQTADSAVTLRGLMAPIEAAGVDAGNRRWILALPTPMSFRGRRFGRIELHGNTAGWGRYDRAYVEARGGLGADADTSHMPYLNLTGVKEVDPEGLARAEASTSFSQRVALTLFILPRTIRWHDDHGAPSGVRPVAVFSMNNHGQARLTLQFPSKDYACFAIEKKDEGRVWEYARQLEGPTGLQEVTLPAFVREMAVLPESAAATPGRYRLRAGICGFREYQLEAEFDVTG